MRVLFVTPYLPTPPRFGGQRRMHGLMAELARRHEVSVLSFIDPTDDDSIKSTRATREYCRRVVTVPNRILDPGRLRKRLQQVSSLLTYRSYEHYMSRTRAMQDALNGLLIDCAFDVVQIEFSQMAVYDVAASRGRPVRCLDEHNIEYDVLKRTAGADVGPLRRAYNAVNWRKLRAEELRAWRRFDGCAVTSVRDERLLTQDAPGVRTAVVPNGVDVDSFAPTTSATIEPNTVLFFGAINYYPNTDGILFFLRSAWPALKSLCPAARLRIVGPKPPAVISEWADPRVEVVGFVDDIRTEIARAATIIVPLRIGGGTRLKVLEAMALAKPVVSTKLGAEGIDAEHGRDILLADDGPGFAREVASVLVDPALARRLGDGARRLVVERYSWRSSVDRMTHFYAELGAPV
ncbi:MAG: glycosyltransferase family 4 protein [Myxococcota bacterium]|nr:glycosyltransferase family 4 protein [Myxococcota bacterium]